MIINTKLCKILVPNQDRELFQEWLSQSHSQFLTPKSRFTIRVKISSKFQFSESNSRNGSQSRILQDWDRESGLIFWSFKTYSRFSVPIPILNFRLKFNPYFINVKKSYGFTKVRLCIMQKRDKGLCWFSHHPETTFLIRT